MNNQVEIGETAFEHCAAVIVNVASHLYVQHNRTTPSAAIVQRHCLRTKDARYLRYQYLRDKGLRKPETMRNRQDRTAIGR